MRSMGVWSQVAGAVMVLALLGAAGPGARGEDIPGAAESHRVTDSDVDDCHQVIRFTQTQEDAPRDLTDVSRQVTDEVNRINADNTAREVEVEWPGDVLHARAGEWLVRASVEGKDWCFVYLILDVDECKPRVSDTARLMHGTKDMKINGGAPRTAEWTHSCHKSSECVNTFGSYECQCPYVPSVGRRSTAKASGAKEFECESTTSTAECCSSLSNAAVHSRCRESFECYTNDCAGGKGACDNAASCIPFYNSSGHACQCPDGYYGNGERCRAGLKPSVVADSAGKHVRFFLNGKPEADQGRLCGCSRPTKSLCPEHCCGGRVPCNEECDPLVGKCVCKKGYQFNETMGRCVDPTPPRILLLGQDGKRAKGESHVVFEQCQSYFEYGHVIEDANEEQSDDFKRKFSITGLPSGCFKHMQNFTVTYKTWTDWTVPFEVKRHVSVVDTDECKLSRDKFEAACPSCVPRCAFNSGAECLNTVGSYTCVCPLCGARGDGFEDLSILPADDRPPSYVNGSGCTDSCAPKITLYGANPREFKVCSCTGPLCGSNDGTPTTPEEWDARVRELVRSDPGELCKGHSTCFSATDRVLGGREIDVTADVIVGEPVQKQAMQDGTMVWLVPHDVVDASGNKAVTMHREIRVKQLTLDEAIADARKEAARDPAVARQASSSPHTCPACPPCSKSTSCPACPICGESSKVSAKPEERVVITEPPQASMPTGAFILLGCLLALVVCCIAVVQSAESDTPSPAAFRMASPGSARQPGRGFTSSHESPSFRTRASPNGGTPARETSRFSPHGQGLTPGSR